MGTAISTFRESANVVLGGSGARGMKRKAESYSEESGSPTLKKKRLMSTSQYIYNALFEQGLNSDVTIVALGTEWKLHKIYLSQSRYFSSMFSGAWKEVDEDIVHVGIEDPNVTIDALNTVFGSLYQDELVLDSTEVIPVMAAATLFQLDGLIEQCGEIMIETISIRNVLKYNEVARQYGITPLQRKTFDWMLCNLTINVNESAECLKQISVESMRDLVAAPLLVVVQTEFSLYILLKMWVFLRENMSWDGEMKDCLMEAHNYFTLIMRDKQKPVSYLNSEEGEKYVCIFRSLRLQHLVMHHLDVEQIETDRIIPTSWFQPIFRDHWFRMLRVNQGVDKGPKQVSESDFETQCVRCGRALIADGQHVWLWTGYQFGQDIVVSFANRNLSLRRNLRNANDHHVTVNNQQSKRHLMYRFNVYSINAEGNTVYFNSSGLKSITLGKNEEVKILSIEPFVKYPILISANFLMTTPLHCLPESEER